MAMCFDDAMQAALTAFTPLVVILWFVVLRNHGLTLRESLLVLVGVKRVYFSILEWMLWAVAKGLPLILMVFLLEDCREADSLHGGEAADVSEPVD